MRAGSAEEFGDGGDYGLLLVFAEFGEDGQGEDFAGGAFCLGEVALGVAEGLEGLLQVERDRVVDLRADFAGGEEFAQGVAASGADHILVPDMMAAGNFLRKDDSVHGVSADFGEARCAQEGVVAPRDCAPSLVPVFNMFELDLEDGSLEAIHAGVPAKLVVVVAAAHAVLAEHAGPFGEVG